jgi:hypothetical protein
MIPAADSKSYNEVEIIRAKGSMRRGYRKYIHSIENVCNGVNGNIEKSYNALLDEFILV